MARYIGNYELSDNAKRLGGRKRYHSFTYVDFLIMCFLLLLPGAFSGWMDQAPDLLPFSSITPGMKINKIRSVIRLTSMLM